VNPPDQPLPARPQPVRLDPSAIGSVLLAFASILALVIALVILVSVYFIGFDATYGSERLGLAKNLGYAAYVFAAVAFLLPFAAVLLAVRALRQISRSAGALRGRVLAWIAIGVSFAILLLLLVIALLPALPA